MSVTKAVVLARGLGSRMKAAGQAELTADQAAAAALGAKAMMPLGGRPFLDHVLTNLVAAGLTDICLVIGPEHASVRQYYTALPTNLSTIEFAIQDEPRGTADAVAAAEQFCGTDRFVVINGDNRYPVDSLRRLVAEPGLATVGFSPAGLVANANIPGDRLSAFGVLTTDAAGNLDQIIEKPDQQQAAELGPERLITMNCWLLGPAIFEACRQIEPSARGEYEIIDAVRWVAARTPIKVVPSAEGVWDLSSRADIAAVAASVADAEVRL